MEIRVRLAGVLLAGLAVLPTFPASADPEGTAEVVLAALAPCIPTTGLDCHLEDSAPDTQLSSSVSLLPDGSYAYRYDLANLGPTGAPTLDAFSIVIACHVAATSFLEAAGWSHSISVAGVLEFSAPPGGGVPAGFSDEFGLEIGCPPARGILSAGSTSLDGFVPVGAGLTVLSHGFIFNDAKDPLEYWEGWRGFMRYLLGAYADPPIYDPDPTPVPGRVVQYVPDTGGHQERTQDVDGVVMDGTRERALLFDWVDMSNEKEGGQAEAAADALFASLVRNGYVHPSQCRSGRPLHFIGHSRGTAVTSEVVQRLGMYGIPVSYVTYLDAHEFGQPNILKDEFFHDPAAQVWSNVLYADNFYQTEDPDVATQNPAGRKLAHLAGDVRNHRVTAADVAGLGGGRPHARVISAYWSALGSPVAGLLAWLLDGGYSRTAIHPDIVDPADPRGRDCGDASQCWTNLRPFACDHGSPDCMTAVPPLYTNDRDLPDHDRLLQILYNGEFQQLDSDRQLGGGTDFATLAGWFGHGGVGWADRRPTGSEVLGTDWYLRLRNNGGRARHNRFYLPESVTGLRFDYCDGGDLQLLINGFPIATFPARPCPSGGGWPATAGIGRALLEPFVGRVATVEFSGERIDLDHIVFDGELGAAPPEVHPDVPGCPGLDRPIQAECSGPAGTEVEICGSVENRMGNQVIATWGVDAVPVSEEPLPREPGFSETRFSHLYPAGSHVVDLTATDECSHRNDHFGYASTTVEILDSEAPAVAASVAIDILWPPNHKFVDVGLETQFEDSCDDDVQAEVVVYSNDEPAKPGKSSKRAGAQLNGRLELRATKRKSGHGLVYLIVVRASDDAMNRGHACTTVVVPHSQGPDDAVAIEAMDAEAHCATFGQAPAGYRMVGQFPLWGERASAPPVSRGLDSKQSETEDRPKKKSKKRKKGKRGWPTRSATSPSAGG